MARQPKVPDIVSESNTNARQRPVSHKPESGWEGRFSGNVADLVALAAERGPDHPALLDPRGGVALNWSRFNAAVDAEATRLREAGVQPADRVIIRLSHGMPFCVALLGALRADAIAVPVGVQAPERELAAIAADCAPTALVSESGRQVSAADGGPRPLGPPDLAAAGGAVTPVTGGEDIAILGYTSGTTGSPRGVRLSHRALLANRAQVALLRPVPVSPADRVLLQLPLFHLYGLGAGLLQLCWAGATGVLMDRAAPEAVLDVIRDERVTVVAGVPSLFRAMLELPAEHLRDGLVSVRLCTAGGAPLAADLARAFSEITGLELHEGYGLTEAGPVLTSTLVGGRAKPGSVGRPLPGGPGVPGVELRLVSPDGIPDSDDPEDEFTDDEPDTGLVAVRGPNLFSGYWPDGAGGPDEDGWFRTTDIGYLDADGDLHLVDRVIDVVIVNGFNVYPREVEQVLDEHPSVLEAAVVGIPDPRTGEAVKAVLAPRPGTTLNAEEVRAHCATRLAKFKVPSAVEIVERLPRSATGKIDRNALRSLGESR